MAALKALVDRALAEDLAKVGDVTSAVAVPAGRMAVAQLISRASGIVAGVDFAIEVFRATDPGVVVEARVEDGTRVEAGAEVLKLRGEARGLLAGERTALNLLQRLSGIATRTRQFVDAVEGTGARILDTRKTTPGLRELEKAAVRIGGGENHRIGLFDQILLKENHFALADRPYAEVVAAAVESGHGAVIAEATDLDEAVAAVEGGAAVVLLDNFTIPDGLREGVAIVRSTAQRLDRKVEVEASGGIQFETVRATAECGVDRISIGSLTHSVVALDLSLLLESGDRSARAGTDRHWSEA